MHTCIAPPPRPTPAHLPRGSHVPSARDDPEPRASGPRNEASPSHRPYRDFRRYVHGQVDDRYKAPHGIPCASTDCCITPGGPLREAPSHDRATQPTGPPGLRSELSMCVVWASLVWFASSSRHLFEEMATTINRGPPGAPRAVGSATGPDTSAQLHEATFMGHSPSDVPNPLTVCRAVPARAKGDSRTSGVHDVVNTITLRAAWSHQPDTPLGPLGPYRDCWAASV